MPRNRPESIRLVRRKRLLRELRDRPRRIRFWLVWLVVGGLLSTGCLELAEAPAGGKGDPPGSMPDEAPAPGQASPRAKAGEGSEFVPESETSEPASPLDASPFSVLGDDELNALFAVATKKVEDTTTRCLRIEGFTESQLHWYIKRINAPPVDPGLEDEKGGFGILETAFVNVSSAPPPADPFESDAERRAFWHAEALCLSAALDEFDRFQVLARPNAAAATVGDDELAAALEWYAAVRSEVEARVQASPAVEQARAGWADCMSELGYRWTDKGEMFAALEEEAVALVGSFTVWPDSLEDLTGPDAAAARSFLAKEHELAEATALCDAPIEDAEVEVRRQFEAELAASHETQLALVRSYLADLYRDLEGYLNP